MKLFCSTCAIESRVTENTVPISPATSLYFTAGVAAAAVAEVAVADAVASLSAMPRLGVNSPARGHGASESRSRGTATRGRNRGRGTMAAGQGLAPMSPQGSKTRLVV